MFVYLFFFEIELKEINWALFLLDSRIKNKMDHQTLSFWPEANRGI